MEVWQFVLFVLYWRHYWRGHIGGRTGDARNVEVDLKRTENWKQPRHEGPTSPFPMVIVYPPYSQITLSWSYWCLKMYYVALQGCSSWVMTLNMVMPVRSQRSFCHISPFFWFDNIGWLIYADQQALLILSLFTQKNTKHKQTGG